MLLSLLEEGDTFVDVGANVGMASLTAARAVGRNGRIIAFEPNPVVATIFQRAMDRNRLQQVVLHNAAIGDEPGQFDLFVPDSNHGEASLRSGFDERPGQTFVVDVVDGNTLDNIDHIRLIKIDVEGFEFKVLTALADVIRRHAPFVITEIVTQHLSRNGTNAQAIASFMATLGYDGFVYRVAPARFRTERARLYTFDPTVEHVDSNVLWISRSYHVNPRKFKFQAIWK